MEHNNLNHQSASTTIACCVFLLFGIVFFSLIFMDTGFIFPRTFPIIMIFPVIFIVIFIPISAALRGNRQRQAYTHPSKIQQSQISMPIQKESKTQTNKPQYPPSKIEEIRAYYCRYCGEKISKSSYYCPQCGTRLKQ